MVKARAPICRSSATVSSSVHINCISESRPTRGRGFVSCSNPESGSANGAFMVSPRQSSLSRATASSCYIALSNDCPVPRQRTPPRATARVPIGIKLSKERKTSKGSLCHHEEKHCAMNRDGGAMNSVTQVTETLRQILEEEANTLAKETGFIQRERIITGADF